MSDLEQEVQTAEAEEQAPVAAKAAKTPKAAKANAWVPKFMKTANPYGYTDPDTGVRYSQNPVKVEVAPKEHSWLDCQIKAGLIVDA